MMTAQQMTAIARLDKAEAGLKSAQSAVRAATKNLPQNEALHAAQREVRAAEQAVISASRQA